MVGAGNAGMAHALTQHDTTGVTVLLAGGVHVDWAQVGPHQRWERRVCEEAS